MKRHRPDHLTPKEAGKRGMTMSQWCAHEQAQDAMDAIEQGRNERIVYALLILTASFATIAVLAMDGLCYLC